MIEQLADNPGLRRRRSLLDFLRSESAGGYVLIFSGVLAMFWANSAYGSSYERLLGVRLAGHPLVFWVNDGLMTIFFLDVGLELRREIAAGELSAPDKLAAPAIAALGGMLLPAILFSAFNWRSLDAMRGWAVPVATDIAFALAVLNVLGRRIPVALKVFLTALAIFDDLGAIIVIALFYTQEIQLGALAGAVALAACLFALGRAGVRALWPFLLGGVVLWALVERSGVHATLAGVALAAVVPSRARDGEDSPTVVLEHGLEPLVAYVILPLFGLVNAGLRLDSLPPNSWRQSLSVGTVVALVVGKQLGVFGAVSAAARFGLASLPAGVTRLQLYGASILCGIGFTMSLFIGNLAFGDSERADEVKLAVFAGSLVSAALGLLVLWFAPRERTRA